MRFATTVLHCQIYLPNKTRLETDREKKLKMEYKAVIRNCSLSYADERVHQFLIVRSRSGKWGFPVFLMKFGETLAQAWEREFSEVRRP